MRKSQVIGQYRLDVYHEDAQPIDARDATAIEVRVTILPGLDPIPPWDQTVIYGWNGDQWTPERCHEAVQVGYSVHQALQFVHHADRAAGR